MLAKPFSSQEFLFALALLDLKKSPGPDFLYGQMLKNLDTRGKQRLVDIINLSWKIADIEKVPSSRIRIGTFANDIFLCSSGTPMPDLDLKLIASNSFVELCCKTKASF
ncbi:hypothetical protein TNCV_1221381 [Trichonephila clavipes]|nr:hypothetical protein TNCV_1221381 [Trichonephila clavipes]